MDETAARLRGAGIDILIEPSDQPWGERLTYVRDPEGNTLMLTAPISRTATR